MNEFIIWYYYDYDYKIDKRHVQSKTNNIDHTLPKTKQKQPNKTNRIFYEFFLHIFYCVGRASIHGLLSKITSIT